MFYIGTLVHKLLYFLDVSTVCNALPWGWPHEWPKHVGVIPCLSHIFIHFSAFISFSYHYLIALRTITDHLKSTKAVLVTRTARAEPDGTRWRTGGEVKGKLANGVGSQYSHATSELGLSSITQADAHTSAANSRLNWRHHRFKWTRPFRGKDEIWFLRVCHHLPHEL